MTCEAEIFFVLGDKQVQMVCGSLDVTTSVDPQSG